MGRFKIYLGILMLVGLIGLAVSADIHKTMSVQVREGHVRATPSFLGQLLGHIAYGDRVVVREEKGDWFLVGLSNRHLEGWIHQSALTPKKIILKAGASDVEKSATTQEIALAGKGFNKQVEEEYQTKNPGMDFTWIDNMERNIISQEEIQHFLEEGRLFPKGGY